MSRVLPILFNTDMVRAILDGTKRVTRRIVKQPVWENFVCEKGKAIHYLDKKTETLESPEYKAPYNRGDILYVRETFRPLSEHPAAGVEYAADWSPKYFENSKEPNCCNRGKWIPSIHMPKKAARIWIKVIDVRVERLRDITNEQILKEGINKETVISYIQQCPDTSKEWERAAHLIPFSELWDSTLKKKDIVFYGWDANPWVWVIEFEQCEKSDNEK